MEKAKEICPTSSFQKIADGAVLVDVRENDEYSELRFNVPNQLHIPISDFESRYKEVPKDIDVIIACSDGNRSLKVTYFLMNHGWNTVYSMKHGLTRWVQKKFPTVGSVDDLGLKKREEACCGHSVSKSKCC